MFMFSLNLLICYILAWTLTFLMCFLNLIWRCWRSTSCGGILKGFLRLLKMAIRSSLLALSSLRIHSLSSRNISASWELYVCIYLIYLKMG